MSAPDVIANRALRKLKVIGATETAAAEDIALATEGVSDAHGVLAMQGLIRWTLDTIPNDMDLAYELMAAYIKAPDFVQPQQPEWMAQGIGMVQQYVYLGNTGSTWAEDF
jgi:hypothetical protein